MKADPGKAGVDNLHAEIEKLTRIRAVGMGTEPFAAVPWKVLQLCDYSEEHGRLVK